MNDGEYERPTFFHVDLPITDELQQMVREYHEYHGDISCKIVKVVRDDVGWPYLLVRCKNHKGEQLSCIESNGGGYISEVAACLTKDEVDLIKWLNCTQ